MRILLLNDYICPVGGAEKFVHQLKKDLEREGHYVKLIGSTKLRDSYMSISRFYSSVWKNIIRNQIKKFKPDVVHINNFTRVLSPSVISVARESKIPIIITLHDRFYIPEYSLSIKGLAGLIKRVFHLMFLKNKKLALVSPSKNLADFLANKLKRNINIIHNGVEIPKRKTKYEKKIIFVGAITYSKGLQTVMSKLNSLKNYKTFILGEGPLKQKLQQEYKAINFLGFQKPDNLYKSASIIVVPSLVSENFPYAVLEAMSHGLCVIASRVGGIPEQIKDNKTGILFERGNKKEFCAKMDALLTNPPNIKKIGSYAKTSVMKNFSNKKTVEEYIKLYKKVINHERG